MKRFPITVALVCLLAAALATGRQSANGQQPATGANAQVRGGISASGAKAGQAQSSTARATGKKAKATPTPTPTPTPEPTPVPTPVPTPTPPPPQVTYRDGMLSVEALNVSLKEVLTAVRNKTGIEFEGIDGANEPVAIVVGPAPEGDVIAGILAGSRYDFMIIGRPDSPGVVQRVILSPKGVPAAIAARPPQPQPAAAADDDNADDQAEDPQDTAMTPPSQPPTAQTQPQGPKTPEQLMEEIRKMKGSPPGDAQSNSAPRKPPL